MPKLAKEIVLTIRGGEFAMSIDGVEFPWHLAKEPITHTLGTDRFSTLNLTLIAKNITTIRELTTPETNE